MRYGCNRMTCGSTAHESAVAMGYSPIFMRRWSRAVAAPRSREVCMSILSTASVEKENVYNVWGSSQNKKVVGRFFSFFFARLYVNCATKKRSWKKTAFLLQLQEENDILIFFILLWKMVFGGVKVCFMVKNWQIHEVDCISRYWYWVYSFASKQ